MLARTPKPIDFAAALRLPQKSPALLKAEDDWRRAVADRQNAQARHIEAARQLHGQLLGDRQVLTRADVDQIGAEIGPLMDAEQAAMQVLQIARDAYVAGIRDDLNRPLEAYVDAISAAIDEFETLLSSGCALNAASVSGRVRLPHRIAGAAPAMLKKIQSLRFDLRQATAWRDEVHVDWRAG